MLLCALHLIQITQNLRHHSLPYNPHSHTTLGTDRIRPDSRPVYYDDDLLLFYVTIVFLYYGVYWMY